MLDHPSPRKKCRIFDGIGIGNVFACRGSAAVAALCALGVFARGSSISQAGAKNRAGSLFPHRPALYRVIGRFLYFAHRACVAVTPGALKLRSIFMGHLNSTIAIGSERRCFADLARSNSECGWTVSAGLLRLEGHGMIDHCLPHGEPGFPSHGTL